jgi:hypothetical protein
LIQSSSLSPPTNKEELNVNDTGLSPTKSNVTNYIIRNEIK